MLVLSQSQAKNYFKKLQPYSSRESCGCCSSDITYVIKGNRILSLALNEYAGYRNFAVSVIAKIKKAGSN